MPSPKKRYIALNDYEEMFCDPGTLKQVTDEAKEAVADDGGDSSVTIYEIVPVRKVKFSGCPVEVIELKKTS